MFSILVFLGLALSIVKANGWLVIPNFAIVFCWGASISSVLVYSYVSSIKKLIADKIEKELKKTGRCPICGRRTEDA